MSSDGYGELLAVLDDDWGAVAAAADRAAKASSRDVLADVRKLNKRRGGHGGR